ncbi:EAL domain-containing protein [Thiorhodococcus mannitoliphagus]|uniref:EAL domain-containing protein n=1 Tax=Thiorhodococcus mannitoliphagus TaxID=329406 RepID=A0A6P1DVY6_9GAMM|nr:EAL domain-containing protein [Thiorhodococcus mannitoliphagus]NEX20262.1 EAL domain-containing protein [Thiorhodococcus mannitoliphagus]
MSYPICKDDDLLSFAEDEVEERPTTTESWHILIVDDEADVHEATELALRNLSVEGKLLRFSHAGSALEAYQILTSEPDFAVVLLDVVMESEDAGLRLVKRIREELGNAAVRIVLRTGQPGYAPEIETIRTYDINDYKTKSELTRVRLFTTLAVAIRSYRQIRQLEMSRRGLELIVSGSTGLSKIRALRLYAEGVVTQLSALLGIAPDGLICAASNPQTGPTRVIAAAGRYRELIHCPLDDLPDVGLRGILQQCISRQEHLFSSGTCLYFGVRETQGIAAFVNVSTLDPVNHNLLQVFCANVTVGFENVLLQERLHDFAYYDQLLGLPNRNRFIQLITERVGNEDISLALIDLDDFAEINTVLDYRFGDLVLRTVADRLAETFGPSSVLARFAGDTFGVLGPSGTLTQDVIEQIFAAPFAVQGEVIRVSATASLIELGDGSIKGEDVLKDASIALKQAKVLNRGRATPFSADLSEAARARIHLLTDLRAAFSAERLFLAYQPQVDLISGKVLGAEALLRWQTQEGHSIPPDRFIPLAEQSGLMIPIGEWVLRTACRQLRHLADLGYPDFRMAINVSHTQFREPGFVPMLERVLEDCRVNVELLELELTESVAIGHIDSTAAKIAEIRDMGISLALDDFGTGYSSLSILKQLKVDRLKIDRSFISEIDGRGDNSGIAELVIALGRQLDLITIAEGVENEAQRSHLLQLGCKEGQGFLFARPMPATELETWLTARDNLDAV